MALEVAFGVIRVYWSKLYASSRQEGKLFRGLFLQTENSRIKTFVDWKGAPRNVKSELYAASYIWG